MLESSCVGALIRKYEEILEMKEPVNQNPMAAATSGWAKRSLTRGAFITTAIAVSVIAL